MTRSCALLAASCCLIATLTPAVAADAAPKPTTYKNCKALNAKYPHGVGRPGARDKTTGKPVTSFTRNAALYQANIKLDRDRDGIACEKR